MDFALADRQQAVADLAAQVLAEAKPDPWKELTQAGLAAVTGPDGDGLGVLDVAVLLTEIGRRPVPVPALATLMTGALPVLRWGGSDLRQALLPGVASGELILTAALREPSDPAPDAPATMLTDGTVSGLKVGVPYAAEAARILVPVSATARSWIETSPGREAAIRDNAGVVLVDPEADGVSLTRTPSAAGQPEYTLRLDRAPVDAVLGPADCARDLYQLAVAGACALADGAVAGALALTRDHVASRRQFGRPLAEFQAVSQQIADIYIASRTLHLAAMSACWRLDVGARAGGRVDAAGDVDVAGYWCTVEAPRAVRLCHHLHGGLGMDASYPLHRYSSLVVGLVRFLGGADYRLERQACTST
jgi:3-oxo-4-pregnene-20-carboxyl-CoA dehydrogenase alpha subunit